jgi:N-acetylglucosamine-6-sulfatase
MARQVGRALKRSPTVALFALLLALVQPLGLRSAEPATNRPNIVLILTDDQRWDQLWSMPNVQHELVDKGVTFENAFVVNSLCCPSRASILTGGYSHTTGVYSNNPPHGGFDSFRPDEHSTIATWLRKAGYTTALVGKYLNHYGAAGKAGYVPQGWSRWIALAIDTVKYYDYPLNIDGTIVHYDHRPRDYSTDVLANRAVKVIHKAKGPLFLYYAPSAPHGPANPDPRDVSRFRDMKPYRPPNYNEADVSDKPAWVQSLPSLSPEREATIDAFRRHQFQSLVEVDRSVGRIVQALADTHRLHNTMIVFTSDNGIAWGEHRWAGKKDAYEESIRVPMVIRYDAMGTTKRTNSNLVLNIDLAPTFAALAGVKAPNADGRSLVPLLDGTSSSWRTDFLIEHLKDQQAPIPTFCAVRSEGFLYVVYATGEEELYDLSQDPFELDNRATDPTELVMLEQMRQRTKELCQPPPPGFVFPY